MKKFGVLLLVLTGVVVVCFIFYGVMTTIIKSFQSSSKNMDAIDSSLTLKQQKKLVDDTQREQKRFRREQEQRLRDLRRNQR